jgi:neutral ceramidase
MLMPTHDLYVGAGKAVIELPKEDFPIKQYTGIHDELHVRVTIIQNDIRVALVSIEITSLPQEAIREFKKNVSEAANIAPEHVWICATHTFSAPHLNDSLQCSITAALTKAVSAATLTLAPAKVGVTKGKCSININRNVQTERGWWLGRNEEGPSVKDVHIVAFHRQDRDEVIAILFNYDIQSSVMDGSFSSQGGKLVSGDLSGEASRYIEREYPGNVVASFFVGCAGDQSPLFKACADEKDIHEDGFVLVEQSGQYLGKIVVEQAMIITEYQNDAKVSIWNTIVRCPEQEMLRGTKDIRPELQYSFNLTGGYVDISIEAIQIGTVLLVGTQPELNSGYGAALKSCSSYQNIVLITMVNGGAKYLPEEEDYERITYTAMNTQLGRGASEVFQRGIASLFSEIENSDSI